MNYSKYFSGILFLFIFSFISQFSFAQSGTKWAIGGNSVGAGDFFGTTNNFAVLFPVQKK